MSTLKKNDDNQDDEDSGSAGGASGEIEFRYRDAASTQPRDDEMSPAELKRLLAVHKDVHKARVDKQKATRQERKIAKEGPVNLTTRKAYTGGMGTGGAAFSKYKTHPIAAKFAGIRDQKISAIPSENTAETNEELKQENQNKNENKNENKLRLQNQPSFSPKPRPF
jgi:hypothetical protein